MATSVTAPPTDSVNSVTPLEPTAAAPVRETGDGTSTASAESPAAPADTPTSQTAGSTPSTEITPADGTTLLSRELTAGGLTGLPSAPLSSAAAALPSGLDATSASGHAALSLTGAVAAAAVALMTTLASLGLALTGVDPRHRRSEPAFAARGRAPPCPKNGLTDSGTTVSGGGFSPTFFLAFLAAFARFTRLMCERVRLPALIWRPAAFVSLLERPG
jgi:hypothetical protein